jgi:S1-C subfamily serine protease
MNTAIYSPSGASAGIGFAVPIDTVNRVAPALITHGKYARPSLGIEFDDDLNNLLRERLGVDGVFALKVQPDGPAASAGIRGVRIEGRSTLIPGDVIVAIGDKPVSTVARLQARLDDFNPGDKVKLSLLRDGKKINVDVALVAGR